MQGTWRFGRVGWLDLNDYLVIEEAAKRMLVSIDEPAVAVDAGAAIRERMTATARRVDTTFGEANDDTAASQP